MKTPNTGNGGRQAWKGETVAIIKISKNEIPDGGCKIVEVSERLRVAVFRVGERCAAINNRCPHRGASLGEGEFDGTTVKCPLHSFRVDVWKGKGNAGKPVQTFPVTVNDDEVSITLDGAAQ